MRSIATSGRWTRSLTTIWERSPIRYVKNARTPTLIVFGQRDERVPPTQGYELYEGLKARGVEAKLVIYPRRATACWSANTRSTTCGE